ncbi:MAG: prepilin-type N-terminal cleavage/methylation domain-containing protein [Acaryochloris sp. RU_4_1]|nr:prepilin-type N-terminal cleavage/methylation domain-containing protein [Acaryochloris sp. RU_4_1]NJR54549.1 prepilin-type N-terminal cleavage/methylation domain-containing protein [Acaryochloris sp. CRU_2_0]
MTFPSNLSHQQQTGFTLVEVLVGLLVIVGFISTAMQALVTATVFKVKGQEISEATTWIQQDLEQVKFDATRLDYAAGVYNPDPGACEATSESAGYAKRLSDQKLGSTNPMVIAKTSTTGNRPYTLSRTASLPTSAPYNILNLEYEVKSADNLPITIVQTKVIPDASLACP